MRDRQAQSMAERERESAAQRRARKKAPGPLYVSSHIPRQRHSITLQTSKQGPYLLKDLPMISRTRRNVWVWVVYG